MRAFLLLLATAALLLAGCGEDDKGAGEPAPSPATTTTVDAGDLEVYEVESAGFSLGVPSSWNATSVDDFRKSGALEEAKRENPNLTPFIEALQQPDSPMKFIAGDPELRDGFATNANVIVEELPEGVEAEEYEQANLENIRRSLALEGEIAEERVDVAAGEALRLEYRHSAGPTDELITLAVVQYVVTTEDEGYVITYTTVPEAFGDYEPQFDASAASFSFL